MSIARIKWDYMSEPECQSGDIVVLVQHGEAEIARYITPKPAGAPGGGGNYVFEICDNEDGLEQDVFKFIASQYPEIVHKEDEPLLFLCPVEFSKRAIWA